MSNNKLSSKMLKAFTKSVKKVESIAFNKKYKENGETFSSFDLLFKHKEGEADKLGDLVKQIWNKKEIPSKSDLKALVKALVDLKDGKSGAKSKKKKKKSNNTETTPSPKSNNALEKKELVSKTAAKSKKATSKPAKPTSKKPSTKAKSPVKEKAKTIRPKVTPKTTSKSSAKNETKSPVKAVKTTETVTSSKVKPATKRSKPINKVVKKTAATTSASKPVTAPKQAIKVSSAPKRAAKSPRVGDNLKLIEGIGPKIESFLKEDGIDTFAKLAKAVPAAIQTMMVAKGGTRYNAYNPAKWPEQAALKVEELKALKSKA